MSKLGKAIGKGSRIFKGLGDVTNPPMREKSRVTDPCCKQLRPTRHLHVIEIPHRRPLFWLSLPFNPITISKMRPSVIASPLSLLLAASQVLPSFGLYFYIDGVTPRCFFEELPKDTLVVGR